MISSMRAGMQVTRRLHRRSTSGFLHSLYRLEQRGPDRLKDSTYLTQLCRRPHILLQPVQSFVVMSQVCAAVSSTTALGFALHRHRWCDRNDERLLAKPAIRIRRITKLWIRGNGHDFEGSRWWMDGRNTHSRDHEG